MERCCQSIERDAVHTHVPQVLFVVGRLRRARTPKRASTMERSVVSIDLLSATCAAAQAQPLSFFSFLGQYTATFRCGTTTPEGVVYEGTTRTPIRASPAPPSTSLASSASTVVWTVISVPPSGHTFSGRQGSSGGRGATSARALPAKQHKKTSTNAAAWRRAGCSVATNMLSPFLSVRLEACQ